MGVVNLVLELRALEKEGLLKRYYSCPDFSLYRVADWSYMAIAAVSKETYDDEGYLQDRYYFAFHLDAEYTRRILENNQYFLASIMSDQENKKEDMVLQGSTMIEQLRQIRDEVRYGQRPSMLDPEVERQLKVAHKAALEPVVTKYGNPPVLSEKSMAVTVALCLLYPLGLPWFYLGRTKTALAMLAGVFIGAFLGPLLFAVVALEVGYLCYFFFRLICGSEKDGKGLPVLSKKTKAAIQEDIEDYNRYRAEGL